MGPSSEQTVSRRHHKRWYQNTALIILTLIFIFPLGLVLTWLSRWSKRTKKVATVLATVGVVAIVVLSVIFAPPLVTVTSALSPVKADTYTLAGTVSPANSEVSVDGKQATVTGTKFHVIVPLKEGDNQLTIHIKSGSKMATQTFKIHRYTKQEVAKQAAAVAAKKKAAADKAKAAADAAAKKKAADAAAAQKKAMDAAAKKKATDAAAAAAAAQKAAANAAAQPQTVLDITGSGIKQTQTFTVRKNWNITYTFDCSNFGSQGNFQIYIENPDGSLNTDAGPNDLATSGGDTDYYYDAGTHYLTINSECTWHVTVKG